MTNEEAIEILKHEHDYAQLLSYVNEALELAISALEKQTPKKPTRTDWIYCPSCNWGIALMKGTHHCPKCGQALDWSENNGN